jgi:sporulation protein YlmC with PRC-barrel domain
VKREGATIDLAALRLVALQVKGDAGTFVIPFDQVQNIGADAITVASSQVTQIPGTDSAAHALLDLDQIGKLKVVDRAGTFLGTLAQLTIRYRERAGHRARGAQGGHAGHGRHDAADSAAGDPQCRSRPADGGDGGGVGARLRASGTVTSSACPFASWHRALP